MFEILPASSARTHARASHALTSTAVHAALIAASILLTARAAAPTSGPSPNAVMIYLPPVRTADPVPPAGGDPVSAPTPSLPTLDPIALPAVGAISAASTASIPAVRSTLGLPGGPGAGADPTWLRGPSAGGAWTVAEVDDPVHILEPGRLVYPAVLERAGVPGAVVVEFVVDTLGRAEPRTLRVVSSTHPAFEQAARDAVLGTRFRPARARGASVRQLARQQLSFVAGGRS
jgi:TonB family protein